jgi:integral membrane protein
MTVPDLHDPVGRVRAAGMVEAVSFLILLVFVPLKRVEGLDLQEVGMMGVRIMGMIHGGLVMLFLLVLFQAWGNRALSGKKCAMAFVASLLPFGPFLIDRRLAESTKQRVPDSAD